VDLGDVADVSVALAACIFSVEVCKASACVCLCLEKHGNSGDSAFPAWTVFAFLGCFGNIEDSSTLYTYNLKIDAKFGSESSATSPASTWRKSARIESMSVAGF
jgi:hypothetical protein